MAHMRDEYGNQSDEYGNQMQQSDEYGNPMQPKGHNTGLGSYGQNQGAMGGRGGGTPDMSMGSYHQETKGGGGNEYDGISTGEYGSGQGHHGSMVGSDMHGGGAMGGLGQQHLGGVLQRSGSSSSSEDDGEGGRRKKNNRKGRLPGGRRGDDSCYNQTEGGGATEMPGGYDMGAGHHQEEKKGIMEKIKEKLPGHH